MRQMTIALLYVFVFTLYSVWGNSTRKEIRLKKINTWDVYLKKISKKIKNITDSMEDWGYCKKDENLLCSLQHNKLSNKAEIINTTTSSFKCSTTQSSIILLVFTYISLYVYYIKQLQFTYVLFYLTGILPKLQTTIQYIIIKWIFLSTNFPGFILLFFFYKYLLSQLSFLLLYLNRLVVYDSNLATIHPPTIILTNPPPSSSLSSSRFPSSIAIQSPKALYYFSHVVPFSFFVVVTAPAIATATDAMV